MATKSKTYTDQMNNAQIMATALSANLETLKKQYFCRQKLKLSTARNGRKKEKKMTGEKIFHTSDSPGYFYTSSISKEFDACALYILSKHKDCPFEIHICLRCLHKYPNWKTKSRFYVEKEDSKGFNKGDFWLGFDVVCFGEDFEAIANIRTNKVVQKLAFGKEFFVHLTNKLKVGFI